MIKLDHTPWRHNFQRNYTYELAADLMRHVVACYPIGHPVRMEQWRKVWVAINEGNAIIHRMIKEK